MKSIFALLAAGLLTLSGAPGSASDLHVWLIGGGNNLANSQGQIEENVRWLEDIFADRGIKTRTYYTHGQGAEGDHDVVYFALPEARDPILEPILRVYGQGLQYALDTRTNSLRNIVGSTEKSVLKDSLREDFSHVGPGDSVLLVYNGHGDINPDNTLHNNLLLWNNTSLNVEELHGLLEHITPEAEVRFVLTQCFSGAFSTLIYDTPASTSLLPQSRCGFLAESDRRESEGCDLSTNQTEFRDYTTYFFAALNGKTRLGETIPADEISSDGSSKVSFRDAHLYTLRNAHSSDLSRSTSEVFMEHWQPWYLRWNSFAPAKPDSDYLRARDFVAEQHQLPVKGLARLRAEWRLRAEEQARTEQAYNRYDQAHAYKDALQQSIATALPNLPKVNAEYLATAPEAELHQLAQVIKESDLYPALLQAQEAAEQGTSQWQAAVRDRTQAKKIFRLARLARLENSFSRYSSAKARRDFDNIISCETGTL